MTDDDAFLDAPSPDGVRDGLGYAIAPDRTTGCYCLSITDERVAHCIVSEIDREGKATCVSSIPLGRFAPIARKVDEDFNRRLIANGHPAGSLPKRGGQTYMNSGFGRELGLLFIAAFDHHFAYPATIAWLEATPTWRRELFAKVDKRRDRTAEMLTHVSDRQVAYEMLTTRAPDGSEDPAKERDARAPLQQMEAQIWAIRRKNPDWRDVLDRKTVWSRGRGAR